MLNSFLRSQGHSVYLFFGALSLLLLSAIVTPANAQTEIGLERLESRLAALQGELEQLEQERTDLDAQYEVLQGSRMLHLILQEARANVRQVRTQDFEEVLAQLRLDLFHAQRQLRDESLTGNQRESLQQQVDGLELRINLLVEFMQVQTLLTRGMQEFEAILAEYLFWTPSNRGFDSQWAATFPSQARDQIQRIVQALSQLRGQLSVQLTFLMAVWVILLVLVMLKRKAIDARLALYDADVLSNRASSPWLIPSALGLHALKALPTSLLILIAAQFINAPVGQGIDLDRALNAVAGALFVVSLLLRILRPEGFAQLYFRWQPSQCKSLHTFIFWLGIVLVPLSFILAVSGQQTTQIGSDVLGQLLLALASLYLIGLIISLFHKLPPLYGSKLTHRLVGIALLLLPSTLLLIVMSGYFYTALMLSGYYLATFYVITLWMLTESGVQRGLDFAYEQMQEAQRARIMSTATTRVLGEDEVQSSSSEQGLPLTDIEAGDSAAQTHDIERQLATAAAEASQAKAQSQRLARFGLMVLFAFILYSIWSEATTALDYLNTRFLWSAADGEAGALSLGGILTAAAIALIGFILVRNLPGLLEMTVLSRLKLQVGTAYAVTSLVNYILISISIIAFLAALGVRWDQLQWLAAGLTVGLGFGLQEIFGNFISGLILLFERPVRVGDVITLNDLSGRVSQIRIRATVITDFDRRDILVPNRQFITGQFVNWTLSNTITRITVRVGVAYGSDLEKTRDILLQIAKDEPRILDEPAPMALFLAFGASTLDHELRVHVNALGDRNPTIDAVNREIDKRFKAAGIEIAFNQIDVHFKNELGIERHIEHITEQRPANDKG